MKRVTMYRTSDGTLFEDEQEAEDYERKLKRFKNWYKTHPMQCAANILCDVFESTLETIPLETVFMWLEQNWMDLYTFFRNYRDLGEGQEP